MLMKDLILGVSVMAMGTTVVAAQPIPVPPGCRGGIHQRDRPKNHIRDDDA